MLSIVWIILSVIVGRIATERGRGYAEWTLFALLVSPIIALLFLSVAPIRAPIHTQVMEPALMSPKQGTGITQQEFVVATICVATLIVIIKLVEAWL